MARQVAEQQEAFGDNDAARRARAAAAAELRVLYYAIESKFAKFRNTSEVQQALQNIADMIHKLVPDYLLAARLGQDSGSAGVG